MLLRLRTIQDSELTGTANVDNRRWARDSEERAGRAHAAPSIATAAELVPCATHASSRKAMASRNPVERFPFNTYLDTVARLAAGG
ncbi:hypothetical protein EVAR_18476_1 [Eumeta japonica]|uniref:Uncharacterized protein n=1 Tax=Eumeta variegata TaxID=151549 RepID=A0A4C1V0Z5_EUMVA|nr:hypothetical protein EVAR_18476_1 [Eumeta japonica]